MSVNAVKSLYYNNKKLFRAIFTSNLQFSIRNHQYTRYAAPSYPISEKYLYIFLVERIVRRGINDNICFSHIYDTLPDILLINYKWLKEKSKK